MRVSILGIPIDVVTEHEALVRIEGFFRKSGQFHVTTPNPEMIVESRKNPEFKRVLRNADLNLPDGIGLVFAIKRAISAERGKEREKHSGKSAATRGSENEKQKVERVAGTDIMQAVCAGTTEKVFLLGASPGIAKKAAEILKTRNGALRIAGTHAGSPEMREDAGIVARVNAASPTALFVAYGAPAQDMWIARNLKRMPSVKVAMGVGGAFDFISREKKRAPAFLRRAGLEWFWRLMLEPGRVVRIWKAVVVFPITFFFRDE